MTNLVLLATIRAKIERRIKELDNDKYINIDAKACRISELNLFERFLDTLSVDAPEGLDEAADTIPLKLLTENKESYIFDSTGMRFPKDCFKAGAEWAFGQFESMGTFPVEDARGGYWPTEYFVRKK